MERLDGSLGDSGLLKEGDRYMENEKYRDLARRAVEEKAREAQRARDLEQALQEMSDRLTQVSMDRDRIARQAQDIVDQRDLQRDRLRAQTTRWRKGEIGAMEAIAGIDAELGGFPLPSFSAVEAQRAVREAQTLSLLTGASDQLILIELMLVDEGVDPEASHAEQVKQLTTKYRTALQQLDRLWTLLGVAARKISNGEALHEAAQLHDYEMAKHLLDRES